MLNLDDEKWKKFYGGYGDYYDASEPLKILEATNEPDEEIWTKFREELHHQGAVGTASYTVIPHLYRIYKSKDWIDANLPSFAWVVEESRINNDRNPKLPEWLE